MTTKQITPDSLPWVIWILHQFIEHNDEKCSDSEVMELAIKAKWIIDEANTWSVNGKWVKERIETLEADRLKTSKDVAMFILGVGEFAARCDNPLIESAQKILKSTQKTLKMITVLNEMGNLTQHFYPEYSNNIVNERHSQLVKEAQWNQEDFEEVKWLLDRPYEIRPNERYGLALGIQIAFPLSYPALAEWLSAQKDPAIIVPILHGLLELANDCQKDIISRCLSVFHPFLKLIGAASLNLFFHTEHLQQRAYKNEESYNIMSQAGIKQGDAIWILANRLKGYSSRIDCQNEEQKRTLLCLSNHLWLSDFKYRKPKSEILRFRNKIDETKRCIDDCEKDIENLLCLIAKKWPEEITQNQLNSLHKSFNGNIDIYINLAEKLSNKIRKDLLKKCLKEFYDKIEIFEGEPGKIKNSFIFGRHDFEMIPQAARAFVLLHQKDNIGRKFGSTFFGKESILNKWVLLLQQPYFRERRYKDWTHAVEKIGFAHYFALEIAFEAERFNKDIEGIKYLRKTACEKGLMLLSCCGNYPSDHSFFDSLSIVIANSVQNLPPDDVQLIKNYFNFQPLYPYAKSLLIWARSDFLTTEDNQKLAMDLLRNIGRRPVRNDDANEQGKRLILIIDQAIATTVNTNNSELINKIIAEWEIIYSDWQDILKNPRWKKYPEILKNALEGNSEMRQKLLEDIYLSNTRCAKICINSNMIK